MRALISVSDKTGIVEFSQALIQFGYEIISTGGTAKTLKENGIPVTPIEDVTQFPEMLDGRVKTLHPKIHGGLLAIRDDQEHMDTCKNYQIEMIDLVVVNLYPFEATIQKPDLKLEEAIENIDIGGPSMIRSAAKNHRFVGVVVNPSDYSDVIAELSKNHGQLSQVFRNRLAQEAFSHTAKYDAMIANFLADQYLEPEDTALPATILSVLKKKQDLRYGENPHQNAAFYQLNSDSGLADITQLHGKELSYNNLLDLDAAWRLGREFIELPTAVIIKHTNPCGVATGGTLVEAYERAVACDPESAFGSIICLNRCVDADTANAISNLFTEAVLAPDYTSDALAILKSKPSIRLIKPKEFLLSQPKHAYQFVDGGMLVQKPNTLLLETDSLTVATTLSPTPEQLDDLQFAFQVVKCVKSNAIVIAKDGQAIGVGAGQMSRVESVKIAIGRAKERAAGAVLASDAFFPFADSIELIAKAGIKAIIQPGGSKRDDEVIAACNHHNIAMVMTGIRHFKH